jgi:UDP-glucose 4-epimerase
MKILVFGGNGRLGQDLQRFTRDRDDLDVTYTRSPSRSESELVPIDVADYEQVHSAVERFSPDVVLHLASITGGAADIDPEMATAVNATSMAHVVRAVSGTDVKRVVFVSSSGVYGDQYSAPINETGALAPGSHYARTKVAAEDYLRDAVRDGLVPEGVILRVFNIFGERFDGSLVTRLLASTPENPVALRGPDNFVRDYIHVDDVMPALIASLSNDLPELLMTYNIGSGEAVSNRQLVDRLSVAHKVYTVITAGERSYSCANITLAQRDLGLRSALRL